MSRFNDFLNSPYHNKNRKAVDFFNVLKKFHPDYSDIYLINEFIFRTQENLFFKNDIKRLMFFCLYELNSIDSLISHIDAHKYYLKNSKLNKEDTRNKFI